MKKSSVIIIAGPPASGKTVLANQIAKKFELPLISKDDIKVQLYQSISDNNMSDDELIAKASYKILFYLFESFVKSGLNFIVESNFDSNRSVSSINKIREICSFNSQTILCTADLKTLYKRFVDRDNSSKRNPALVCKQYHDYYSFSNRQNELKSHLFNIGGERIIYDTTEFNHESAENILKKVENFLLL